MRLGEKNVRRLYESLISGSLWILYEVPRYDPNAISTCVLCGTSGYEMVGSVECKYEDKYANLRCLFVLNWNTLYFAGNSLAR